MKHDYDQEERRRLMLAVRELKRPLRKSELRVRANRVRRHPQSRRAT